MHAYPGLALEPHTVYTSPLNNAVVKPTAQLRQWYVLFPITTMVAFFVSLLTR